MTITLVRSLGVQTANAIGNGANSDTASFAALPAVGNHIIGMIAGFDNDLTAIGLDNFADNQGNTYTRHLNVTNTDYDCYTGGASAKVATSSGTFTVGIDLIGSNNYVAWDAVEVSGLDASSWFDQSGTNNSATGDANAAASGANTTADGIAIGVCAVNNGSSDINIDDTPPSGYTLISFCNDSSGIIGGAFAYKIYSASETSSIQFNHDNVSQTGWTCGIMTFKAAGGGGGGGGQPAMRRWRNIPHMRVGA